MDLRKKSAKMPRRAISMTNLNVHVSQHMPPPPPPPPPPQPKPKRPRYSTMGSQTMPLFYMEAAEMMKYKLSVGYNGDNFWSDLVEGDIVKQKLKEIFYSISWLKFSSVPTSSNLSPVSPAPGTPDSVFKEAVAAPKKNVKGLSGKWKMPREITLEEELQERLAHMAEIANLWRQKCRIERDDNIRLCEHLYLCERKCQYLVNDLSQHYEDKILELEEKVIRTLKVQEMLIHEKSDLQKDYSHRIDRLETSKKQMEDKTVEMDKHMSKMKEETVRLKKDNSTLLLDTKKQSDEYEKRIREQTQNGKMLEDKCSILENKLKDMKKEIIQIEEENSLISTENRTYRKENECLIHEIINKGKHMESKTKDLVLEMGKLKDELCQLRKRNNDLAKDNICYKNENHRLLEEFSAIKMDLENSEYELEDVRKELTSMQVDYENIKSEKLAKEKEAEMDLYGMILEMALDRLKYFENNWCQNMTSKTKVASEKAGYNLKIDPENPVFMSMERVQPKELAKSTVLQERSQYPPEPDQDVFVKSDNPDQTNYLPIDFVYSKENAPKRHRTFSDPLSFDEKDYLESTDLQASTQVKRSASGSIFPSLERIRIRNKSLRRNVLSLSADEIKLLNTSTSLSSNNISVDVNGNNTSTEPEQYGSKLSGQIQRNLNQNETQEANKENVTHNLTIANKDTTYTEPFMRNLTRRSVSQKDLLKESAPVSDPKSRRSVSSKSLLSDSADSSGEEQAVPRISGFGALCSRRNGIIDSGIPPDITRQLKSLNKKKKAKDFTDIIRRLSRDQSELNKKMTKKRTKSLMA